MPNSSPRRTILIVDDDATFSAMTKEYLESSSRTVLTSGTSSEALGLLKQRRVDVVLLDQSLPDGRGDALCPEILTKNEQAKIIFITAHPSYESAVTALRAGAYDYLHKPFEPEALALAVDRAIRTLSLEDVVALATYQSHKEHLRTTLIGAEGGLAEVSELIALVAEAGASALITGETGTGKSVVAKAIHFASSRRERPFVTVNCAALPEGLIEAELFGHEKGAFTGAGGLRRGMFEMANGGTLFLDEIGDMPQHLQAKLLGVLEASEVRRLGGESVIPIDVRVIAATAADLEAQAKGGFRRDLFFRLAVVKLHMPSLRERPQDIPALCEHFLSQLSGRQRFWLDEAELERLKTYRWPGNVRELRNVLERATIVQPGPRLSPSLLLHSVDGKGATHPEPNELVSGEVDTRPLETIELEHIRRVFEAFDRNKSRTAKALGVSLSTLKRKAKRFLLF